MDKRNLNRSLDFLEAAFFEFREYRGKGMINKQSIDEFQELLGEAVDALGNAELNPSAEVRTVAEMIRIVVLDPIHALLDLTSSINCFPTEEMKHIRKTMAQSDDAHLLSTQINRQGRALELEDMLVAWISWVIKIRM